jgi:hypothetical protein
MWLKEVVVLFDNVEVVLNRFIDRDERGVFGGARSVMVGRP